MPELIIKTREGSIFAFENGVIASRYTVVDQSNGSALQWPSSKEQGPIISPLGEGGFGCLLRTVNENDLPRAVKLVRVFDQIPEQRTSLAQVEVRLTNAKPFKNVVSVIEAGHQTDSHEQAFDYYVSPFVEGQTLDVFMNQIAASRQLILSRALFKNRLRDQILHLINDLIGALVELDRAKVVHMDLKPNNILIYPRCDNPLGLPMGPHGTVALQPALR